MLRGRDVQDIEELKRQVLSIRAISGLTGYDRKTIRKYLIRPESAPTYGPRPAAPSKLDAFKPYLDERLKAGVWNAHMLVRFRSSYQTRSANIQRFRTTGMANISRVELCRSL